MTAFLPWKMRTSEGHASTGKSDSQSYGFLQPGTRVHQAALENKQGISSKRFVSRETS